MEMIINFRRNQREHRGIEIKGETVERVKSYKKYLGITFDDKLSWKCHVDAVVKKVHSRLYRMRKLRSFDVREDILQMFYTATISRQWFNFGNDLRVTVIGQAIIICRPLVALSSQ